MRQSVAYTMPRGSDMTAAISSILPPNPRDSLWAYWSRTRPFPYAVALERKCGSAQIASRYRFRLASGKFPHRSGATSL